MTTDKEREALRTYDDLPTDAGDLVLVLDESVVLEIEGGADHWDEMLPPAFVAHLAGMAQRLLPCVARPGADLLDADRAMWAQLQQMGEEAGLEVAPLQALRAA